MAHSHAEVPSLQCPQCGASVTAEIGLIVDEDKLREAQAAAVSPAVAEVLGTSMQKVNSEMTGRAGAELVALEAAMAVAGVGADKRGGKRRLAPAVMLGLLGVSLLGACAPAVVEPQAGVVTIQAAQSTEVQGVVIVSTEESTRQPEVVASLTPNIVGLMAESPGINESGWFPPTIEDTILTNQATGGELPPELQPLIDQAQATMAVTGFAQARVETVTNGQAGDAFRAAFVFRVPEGVIWAQGSAYPSQLNPDGSVSQSHAYVLVPGSADARIEWTPGADGSPDTETTLVKHAANLPDGRQAALLYWHTTEQAWKPIGGYQTAQEFVAVGDIVYQFSPEDGSAVEIGAIASLQSLNSNNGRVEATDASGQVFWFEGGRFVNEALLAAEATPTPEITVAEGEVRYEFTDTATGEALAVALPQEWVQVIEKAENKPNQEYKDVPLAQARVEGEVGSRSLMVGNIAVAVESGSGWERNEAVYTIPGYLGFEGVALAQDEYLGSADPETIPTDARVFVQNVNQHVDGIGTFTVTYADRLMPVEATRTHIAVVQDDGELLVTATMKLKFAYRDKASGEIRTFITIGHYITYYDNEPVLLALWQPPLGALQTTTGFMWGGSGAFLPQSDRRDYAEKNNYAYRLAGFSEIQGSGGMSLSGVIDLPVAHFASTR